ncbi:AsmA family protein [Aquincola sp. MAHUQ-54]|uniref:AsmA family protein n=1 Tax=Aquincola agrisoli TaxID=3119538 RepID=A0AAW9QG48_9BURK
MVDTAASPPAAHPAPPRPRRGFGGWAWRVSAALLVLLVLVVLVSEAIGWRYLRGPIERQAAQSLGVPVRIDAPFSLHLLRPPQASAGGLWVGAAPGTEVPFLVDARDVRLRWRWSDLRAFRNGEALRLAALEAGSLEAYLRRDKQGRASWLFRTEPPAAEERDAPMPQVDRLRLRQATLHVDDEPLALQLEARARLNEGAAPGAASTQEAASRPATPASAASPSAGPDAMGLWAEARGRYQGMPVRITATSPQVLPSLDDGNPAPLQVTVDAVVGRARLAYDGQVHDPLGARGIEGAFRISGPSLGAVGEALRVTLPTTPPFVLRGQLRKTDPVWHVAVAEATVGRSALRGDFAYDPQPATPRLTGRLEGRRLALEDLAPSVGADGAPSAPPPNTRNGGPRVIPDRAFDLPSLRAMDADVQVALDELDLNTTAVEPLRPLAGRVRLDGGVLRIEALQARTAGGSIEGSTGLDSNAKPPRWTADLRWRGVDLAGWLRGARKDNAEVTARSGAGKLQRERQAARSGDAPVKAYVTGELQGELKLSGAGTSTAQLLGSLDGQARAVVRDGTLSHLVVEAMGIDVAQALGMVIKGDESLPLNCAVVAVEARNGVVTPKVAVFDTTDSTLAVSGQVDLRNELLDLRGNVRPKDFSFLSLRTPLRVTGSFNAPNVGVEPGPIAARVAAGAALAVAVGPLAALLPLLDPGSGAGDGCKALVDQAARGAPEAAKSRP